jgi:hypothetical protein
MKALFGVLGEHRYWSGRDDRRYAQGNHPHHRLRGYSRDYVVAYIESVSSGVIRAHDA